MAIDFPPSPTLGEIYTADSGRSWQWNGTAWDVYSPAGGLTQYVSQLNGLCGSINIAAGSSISVTPTGNTLTIAYTGTGGGGGGNTGPTGPTGPQGNTGNNGTNGNTGPTGPQGNTGNNGNTGATGQQGEPGQSSNYYNYKVHTTTQTPPTGNGEIRYNNASQIGSTLLYVDHLDSNGDDIDIFLSLLKQNDNLIIQDASDSNNYQTWRITSAPTVILNDYTTIPVTGITSAGTGTSGFANNHQVLFIVFSSPIATQYVESLRGLTGAIGLTNGNGIDLSVSGNTLTVSNGGVLTVNGLTGTVTNIARTTDTLAQFASTTSAQLASIISNETGGGGVLVFNTSPTITTSITTASTSFALVNTTATTLNLGGAATTLTMGGTSGTASIRNATLLLGNTNNTITTNSGTTNYLNIQPYGNIYLQPTSTAIGFGSITSLIVTNDGSALGQVQISGGDLALGVKSANGFSTTPVNIIFEGATDDGNETTLTVVDPTADRTITFPDASGTVALTSGLVSSLSGSTYISVSGSTGAVTITNTGVQTFNGLTGAVTGVTVGGTNVFTALNSFNAGISASGATFSGNISAPNIVTSFNGSTGAVTGLTAVGGTYGSIQYKSAEGLCGSPYLILGAAPYAAHNNTILKFIGPTGEDGIAVNAQQGLEFSRVSDGLGLDNGGGAGINSTGYDPANSGIANLYIGAVDGVDYDLNSSIKFGFKNTSGNWTTYAHLDRNPTGDPQLTIDNGCGLYIDDALYTSAGSSSIFLGNANFEGLFSGITAAFTGLLSASKGISASGATFATDISVNSLRVGRGAGNQAQNVALGKNTLTLNTTGDYNLAIGSDALASNLTGIDNVGLGYGALTQNTSSNNLGIGSSSLGANTTGADNVGVGTGSLGANSTGSRNVAIGRSSLGLNGDDNVGIGAYALSNISTGAFRTQNTAIGSDAGRYRTGALNLQGATGGIYIGYGAKGSANAQTNEIVIGTLAEALGSNTAVIGATTQTAATIYGVLRLPGGLSAASGITLSGNVAMTSTSSHTGLASFAGGLSAAGGVTFGGTVASDTGYRITSNAIKAETGTTYTFLESDNGKVLTFNNGSAVTVTIPTALPVGFNCTAIQLGTGQVGFTAASGLTLQSYGSQYRLIGQHAAASIIEYSANIVNLSGNLVT